MKRLEKMKTGFDSGEIASDSFQNNLVSRIKVFKIKEELDQNHLLAYKTY